MKITAGIIAESDTVCTAWQPFFWNSKVNTNSYKGMTKGLPDTKSHFQIVGMFVFPALCHSENGDISSHQEF